MSSLIITKVRVPSLVQGCWSEAARRKDAKCTLFTFSTFFRIACFSVRYQDNEKCVTRNGQQNARGGTGEFAPRLVFEPRGERESFPALTTTGDMISGKLTKGEDLALSKNRTGY